MSLANKNHRQISKQYHNVLYLSLSLISLFLSIYVMCALLLRLNIYDISSIKYLCYEIARKVNLLYHIFYYFITFKLQKIIWKKQLINHLFHKYLIFLNYPCKYNM